MYPKSNGGRLGSEGALRALVAVGAGIQGVAAACRGEHPGPAQVLRWWLTQAEVVLRNHQDVIKGLQSNWRMPEIPCTCNGLKGEQNLTSAHKPVNAEVQKCSTCVSAIPCMFTNQSVKKCMS